MAGYSAYKRDILRGMLENRGGTPGSKIRDTLIEELQILDQGAAPTVVPPVPLTPAPVPVPAADAGSVFERKVRQRVALFGAAPSEAAIHNAIQEIRQEEERDKESEDRDKEREHELRLAEARSQRDTTPHPDRSTARKVPFQAFKDFREMEDEIERYLQDFERLCQVHEVHRADRVRILACKLTGRAAEAYRTVPDEEATNYAHVKQALLSRFAVTPEASRAKFRNSRRPNGATHVEWAHRLQRDLRTWFLGSKAETVDDITQLLLLEQFFEHTPSAIREWVRDKKPQTVQQAAAWADEYADTRKVAGGERFLPSRPALPTPPPPEPAVRGPAARPTSRPNTLTNVRCYGCNQEGHYRQNCPNRPVMPRPPARPSPSAHCYDAEAPWPDSPEEWERLHEADPVQPRPRPTTATIIVRRCGLTGEPLRGYYHPGTTPSDSAERPIAQHRRGAGGRRKGSSARDGTCPLRLGFRGESGAGGVVRPIAG
uniref:CCHC-type domain-containing protein n=1 Tax=Leptobrachium leishanense TaxID=445787 RepID=A0A8C5Q5A3_9ANUR